MYNLFSAPDNIAGPGSRQSLFCLMKIPVSLLLAWTAQQSEAREAFQIAPLARTQSERRQNPTLPSILPVRSPNLALPVGFSSHWNH
jgi:hypothetical protein